MIVAIVGLYALLATFTVYFHRKINKIVKDTNDRLSLLDQEPQKVEVIIEDKAKIVPITQAQRILQESELERLNQLFDAPYTGIDEEFGV